ncbi:MAG: hypothetical protein ACLPV8_14835 [Steroidobacteraceae bacterium]
MDIRKLTLAAAVSAAIAPSISNANPEDVALKACARAFASSIATPGSTTRPYKLVNLDSHAQSAVASYYEREYTFYLQARDPKSGVTLARAACSTDKRGMIVALRTAPLDSANPTLAAEF